MSHSEPKLAGKVQTVLGSISPDEMGITLAHEHCLVDATLLFNEPKEALARKIAYERVSFSNVGYIRYHRFDNRDNLQLLDEEQAINELLLFKGAGGGTVVDATMVGLGRNPLALKRISQATGLNIIMGSGYYVKAAQNLDVMDKRTEEDIAEEIVQNLVEGVEGTGIHSGIIGELGMSWPLEDCEKKVLRAAGIAQKEAGAPMVIHPGRSEDSPAEIIKILKEVGADLNHTTIIHTSRTLFEPKNRYMVAEAGCYLEYDAWGWEGYWPDSLDKVDIPNDVQRIAQIKDLIEHGFAGQILISHDIAYKDRYMSYGGHGYTHILHNAVPVMRSRGMSEKHINNLLIENPKQFFAFR